MSENKIIAVVGATGAQGGGLARAILNDPQKSFQLRAITRNPDSDAAKALKEQGAQVVSADLDDKQSLVHALRGAYGAFFVTNFWEHFSPEKENGQAKNLAEAAKEAGLQHVIWSTLEDTRKQVPLSDDRMPTLLDKYKVPHFDSKGSADQHFRDAGVPTTFLLTTFYWDNLVHFGMGPTRGEDGKLAITFPMGDKKLAGIAAEDIGKCALGIFKEGKELAGKTVGIAGELITVQDMADTLGDAIGEEVTYNAVPPSVYRGFGFPGAEDLGNMFQYYAEFEDYFEKVRDVNYTRKLNPELKNFRQWVNDNASKLKPSQAPSEA